MFLNKNLFSYLKKLIPFSFPFASSLLVHMYTLQLRTIVINLEPIKPKEAFSLKRNCPAEAFVRMRGEQLRSNREGHYAPDFILMLIKRILSQRKNVRHFLFRLLDIDMMFVQFMKRNYANFLSFLNSLRTYAKRNASICLDFDCEDSLTCDDY